MEYKLRVTFLISGLLGFGLLYNFAQEHCGLSFVSSSHSIISVKVLLALGADVNGSECQKTPLMNAANDPEVVQLLLDHQADVNRTSPRWGMSALHKARGTQAVSVAKLLLAAGADINYADRHGKKAIDHAIKRRNKALIQFLIHQISIQQTKVPIPKVPSE